MVLHRPVWMQAAIGDPELQYTGKDLRGIVDAIVPVEGVCSSAAFQVTQRALGANLSVDINAGYAVIQGDAQAGQGKYVIYSDEGENRTLPAPPGTGSRTHVVYLQVRDRQMDGGNDYDSVIVVSQDQGSGAPVLTSAIPLARVTVTAGQSSVTSANIADVRPFARGLGASGTQPYYGFKTGNTDAQAYIWLTHTLGRKPAGCVATFSHPAPAAGTQATHITVDMSTATTTQVRARVWWLQPYNVWTSKPVNISYVVW